VQPLSCLCRVGSNTVFAFAAWRLSGEAQASLCSAWQQFVLFLFGQAEMLGQGFVDVRKFMEVTVS